jgi:hypothetical protein
VDELVTRVGLLLRVLVPFVFMMATVYLATHLLFASMVSSPRSQVLWFFGVVTGPLTRPVRAVLPAATPERRVRALALVVYLVLWIVSSAVLGGGRGG